MKKIIGIGIFLLLLVNLNGQITLREVSWIGDEMKEISLDSILPIPAELFFSQILQEIEEQPFSYGIRGRYGKIFLLYEGQLLIENFAGNSGIDEIDKFISNIMRLRNI